MLSERAFPKQHISLLLNYMSRLFAPSSANLLAPWQPKTYTLELICTPAVLGPCQNQNRRPFYVPFTAESSNNTLRSTKVTQNMFPLVSQIFCEFLHESRKIVYCKRHVRPHYTRIIHKRSDDFVVKVLILQRLT